MRVNEAIERLEKMLSDYLILLDTSSNEDEIETIVKRVKRIEGFIKKLKETDDLSSI